MFADLLTPWEPSILVPLMLGVTALLYIVGSFRTPPGWASAVCFWLGLFVFYAASFTRFDAYAEHAFFMHRLQHGLLHHMAPFLIALSRPGAVMVAALPADWGTRLRRAFDWPPLVRIVDGLNHPVVAVTLFIGLTVLWLVPGLHTYAMLDVRLYKLMNASIAADGLMFWGLVLNNFALRPARLSPVVRMAMTLAIVPPQIVIGLVLLMSGRDLYPIYSLCGRVFALSPLADQQLGGAVLWLSAAMMSTLGCGIIAYRSFARSART